MPHLKILIALADTVSQPTIPTPLQANIAVMTGKTDQLVAASNAVICASGTATLEVALAEKPLVVIYKTSLITFALAKCFVKIPYIGLCNIIAKKFIAKELIQGRLTTKELATETARLLQDTNYRNQMTQEIKKTRSNLGNQYNVDRLISVIEHLLASHS